MSRLELGNTSNVKWIGAIGEYRMDQGTGFTWPWTAMR